MKTMKEIAHHRRARHSRLQQYRFYLVRIYLLLVIDSGGLGVDEVPIAAVHHIIVLCPEIAAPLKQA